MQEFEINQRIYQLTESLQLRDLVDNNTYNGYTVKGQQREDLKTQLYNVLMLPVESEVGTINSRVNSILNALRLTEVDETGSFNGHLFKDVHRENLADRLVEILKIQL